MKVLIVDDLSENLDLLEDILNTYNYSCVRANDGIDALDKLQENYIGLIISDILMPRMDGFRFCIEVKKDNNLKDIPFIFYTAHYYDPEDKEYAYSIGADKYFVKPVDINVLMESVNNLFLKYKNASKRKNIDFTPLKDTSDLNVSISEFNKLKNEMFELGLANEKLMQKNKELIISQHRYRNLFENASDAIFLIESKTGTILDANLQAVKYTGYLKEELLGMRLFDIPENLNEQKIFETIISHKNGDNLIFEITANPISHEETGIIQAIARNVTEQRKIKEKLIQTDKLVSLGHLSAGIAHEIRNPLASVNINLQLLSRMLDTKTEEYEILKAAIQGIERIKKIVDSTLDYVRTTKTSDKLENLNEIIHSTMPLIQISLVKKDIEIKLELDSNIPLIKVDAKQIQQVLINLLSNAIESINHKGEIIIKTLLQNNSIFLSISDTGEGISKENLSRIFEPFYTKKVSGTGLGLSVVKQILDSHHATITVQSEVNKGTSFTIQFPINI
ncbi:MAG TPA: ATP-binding protein [Bacteroidota bacterium]|nr:ATP-binding protein [Bacteroidota bacterium]